MTPEQRVKRFGIALLAPRSCSLGEDPCGGSEVVLWEDAAIIEAAGIPVRVYARAAKSGARVAVIPLRTELPLITSLEYGAQFLSRERQSILLAYNEPSLAGWAPDRSVIRFDWTTGLPRYWNWPYWLSRFQRSRYLFPSDSQRQLFLQQHPKIPATRARLIFNSVDLALFRRTPEVKDSRPGKPLKVGYAGQWVPSKGTTDLLQAWRSVKAELPEAELSLAGGPDLWKNVTATATAEDSAAMVREMEGMGLLRSVGALPRSEMPAFWNSVDIAVLPSHYESFGLAAVEASACGIPVVATRAGALAEVVVDGESGLLVPPRDPVALAKALSTLLRDAPLRRRLGEGARRKAQQFSRDRRSRELLQYLLSSGTTADHHEQVAS